MIWLASFFSRLPEGISLYSVARWQPRGCSYPELRFFAPLRPDGTAIRHLPPGSYLEEYGRALASRIATIEMWLASLEPDKEMALLCWCNKKRQAAYPRLMCHTILVGWLIEAVRPDVAVHYLDGREKPVWTEFEREKFLGIVFGGSCQGH